MWNTEWGKMDPKHNMNVNRMCVQLCCSRRFFALNCTLKADSRVLLDVPTENELPLNYGELLQWTYFSFDFLSLNPLDWFEKYYFLLYNLEVHKTKRGKKKEPSNPGLHTNHDNKSAGGQTCLFGIWGCSLLKYFLPLID